MYTVSIYISDFTVHLRASRFIIAMSVLRQKNAPQKNNAIGRCLSPGLSPASCWWTPEKGPVAGELSPHLQVLSGVSSSSAWPSLAIAGWEPNLNPSSSVWDVLLVPSGTRPRKVCNNEACELLQNRQMDIQGGKQVKRPDLNVLRPATVTNVKGQVSVALGGRVGRTAHGTLGYGSRVPGFGGRLHPCSRRLTNAYPGRLQTMTGALAIPVRDRGFRE